MKLTEKSLEVFSYVKENGGRVPIDELCEATGRAARSIGANVTDLCKKGLAAREKVAYLLILRVAYQFLWMY